MLGTSAFAAQQAAAQVVVAYEADPQAPVLSIEDALARDSLYPLSLMLPM